MSFTSLRSIVLCRINGIFKTSHLFSRSVDINLYCMSSRQYAFKSELKIKWVRPEKISCIKPEKSGDLLPKKVIDKSIFPLRLQSSEELKTADENVKRLFSLEFLPRCEETKIVRQDMIDLVKRHDQDLHSMESKIANMTARIRCLQELMENYPRNKKVKVYLKELIDKRKKFLKYLRRWDYKRFEWLLEKLDIVYKPPPKEFHWITRKDSLRKLTNKYCDEIKEKRLLEYRTELEGQLEGFLEEKIQNLEHIRDEQIKWKVPITIKQSEIDNVKKELEEIKIKKENNN